MGQSTHLTPLVDTASAETKALVPGKGPVRVLHCLWSGGIGGAERAVYQLVREQLRDPEIEPALLFAQRRGLYWERAASLGCAVLALDLPHSRAIHKVPEVTAAMRGYDIHHFHSGEPLLMLGSVRCSGVYRVYTHRGGVIDYSAAKRLKYKAAGLLLRRYFDGFSGNTIHGARSGARLYRLPEEHFRITYNGLDFDLLIPDRSAESVRAELGLAPDAFVLGTAAQLKPWKRIERLIGAVAGLSDARVRLVVLGEGPDRLRLEEHAQRLGVTEQVVFAGIQRRPWDYVQIMDAFCLPSMGLESFGNAAVEAMALGVATIVFADGGGLVEHIEDGETGFVVSNQAELEQTIRRLIDDVELRRRIGQRARVAVRERYPISGSARVVRALYAEVLQRSSSGRAAA